MVDFGAVLFAEQSVLEGELLDSCLTLANGD
jgi:hypothetical protein